MKLLFVSNVYPPHSLGGYEMQCKKIADAFKFYDHDVYVLTSTYNLGMMKYEEGVFRTLSMSHPWIDDLNCDLFNDTAIVPYNYKLSKTIYTALRPDLIFFWNPLFISLSPVMAAQDLKIPRCFYLSDNSLFRYQAYDKATWTAPLRKFLWSLPLRVQTKYQSLTPLTDTIRWDPVICCSKFIANHIKSHDINLKNISVVHHGIHAENIPSKKSYKIGKTVKIIYFGQIVEHKGVFTLIEAINRYRRYHKDIKLKVDLIGPSTGNYQHKLEYLVDQYGLQKIINFKGQVSNKKLTEILSRYDMNIFPSEWEEPFSIGLLEAMGAGLPVISTSTGGSREIIRNNVNALRFKAGDAAMLAKTIHRLIKMPENKRKKIGQTARKVITEKFTFHQMYKDIEAILNNTLNR